MSLPRRCKARLHRTPCSTASPTCAARYDVVICEGAGSPAEINLRAARHREHGPGPGRATCPCVVVGDIDRGGVFASLFGTLALLDAEDQALVAGFVVNKFRGDARAARSPGWTCSPAHRAAGVGVLPWLHGLWLDVEDSLDLERRLLDVDASGAAARRGRAAGRGGALPADLQLHRRGRAGRRARRASCGSSTRPEDLADADLVVLPGSRATVSDLAWLRERGLADAVARRAAEGRPVLGICGGYQMLAREIQDDVESGAGAVRRARPAAGGGAVRARRRCSAARAATAYGEPVEGYEIHHGVVDGRGRRSRSWTAAAVGAVWGTHLARRAGERRLPAGVPARGGRARPAGGSSRPPTSPSPRCARRGSTRSATWWRPPRTPTRCAGSSSTARRRDCPSSHRERPQVPSCVVLLSTADTDLLAAARRPAPAGRTAQPGPRRPPTDAARPARRRVGRGRPAARRPAGLGGRARRAARRPACRSCCSAARPRRTPS